MTTNKEIYREFCKQQPELPLFLQDWWLDAVCFEGPWDAAVVSHNGQVSAVMPYYLVKGKLGHHYLTTPVLTPFLGPWLIYPTGQKTPGKLSFERKVLTQLIQQFPPFDAFYQSCHYSLTNGLPFYWQDFELSVGYTYVLEDLSDWEAVFASFRENIRREIRKAEKQITVSTENNIEKFYRQVCATYSRQQAKPPYSLDLFKQIDQACSQRNCRSMFFAEGAGGQIHAALYLVWDRDSAYYIAGGGDPELRTSGATSLLMWKAILKARETVSRFDFEGSMIQPIERFFSAFGTVQKPYLQLTKINSRFLKIKQLLR